MQADADKSNNK